MKPLTGQEREALLRKLLLQLYSGEISEGAMLRQLRKEVLGLTQERYAALVGISRRTLSEIERDKAQLTLSVYSAVFKPLGLKPGLLPRSDTLLQSMLKE
ncbi:helix-turn-helix domain-containing protein [Marinobacterium sp. D7]|uniref:helix-turn-helix transcriptional regulator n=1 Tax=Marinobacterium ramblicola TaxID=2849041 RepID=UPI001C2CFCC4|nr:helix-turn-helix domain-containing protein [Marinobacterium ramblicola]MBV1788329.1 helix-turn-helix domain-containing protein [Marinobacterium ramblicola]